MLCGWEAPGWEVDRHIRLAHMMTPLPLRVGHIAHTGLALADSLFGLFRLVVPVHIGLLEGRILAAFVLPCVYMPVHNLAAQIVGIVVVCFHNSGIVAEERTL